MKTIRRRQQFLFKEPSKTLQAHKDECDVNQILAKYQKTQLLTHVNRFEGSYGDFSNVNDYQTSLNAVMDAENNFMALPASIRAEFNNDPGQFVDFMSNDQNYDKALSLGLLDDQKAKDYLAKKEAALQKSQSTPSPKPKKDAPLDLQNDD